MLYPFLKFVKLKLFLFSQYTTFGRETSGRRHVGARAFGRSAIWALGHLDAVPFRREIRENDFLIKRMRMTSGTSISLI